MKKMRIYIRFEEDFYLLKNICLLRYEVDPISNKLIYLFIYVCGCLLSFFMGLEENTCDARILVIK